MAPILDIFKRKKRKDEFVPLEAVPGAIPEGFPPPTGAMPGMEPLPGLPAGPAGGPPPEIQRMVQQIDALNYKLDALRAALDSINTRLANIETALKASPGTAERGEGWTY